MVHFTVQGKVPVCFVHLNQHELRDVLIGPRVPSVLVRFCVSIGGKWYREHGFRRPILESLGLIGRFRRRPGPHVGLVACNRGKAQDIGLLRVGWVNDIEQRNLRARPIKSRSIFVRWRKANGQQMIS